MPASIDLLLWPGSATANPSWDAGKIGLLPARYPDAATFMNDWARNSSTEYLLLWRQGCPLPALTNLEDIMKTGVDIAHCGLLQGVGGALEELCILGMAWDKLNAPVEIRSTSWKLDAGACLIRREVYLQSGGLDPVFEDAVAGGLEFGYRCLKLGAVVEHHPLLYVPVMKGRQAVLSAYDRYCFVLRHYGNRWAQYFAVRMFMRTFWWATEWKEWQRARAAVQRQPAGWSLDTRLWQVRPLPALEELQSGKVSVILPTLGRYEYVTQALDSLLRQTVPPAEVIVVDQNPSEIRQPGIYQGYAALNLKVIWQDERGQSLARNAGLQAARHPYVLLFDDDSIAAPDMIQRHLEMLYDGQVDVSTGVSYPPPPAAYTLPKQFQFLRLSQTFDTGNSMLPLALARKLGGLDRNYDFGPGTDADFGTRLYLAGYRILHNPQACRIHYKAETGGLRVHGARKYNTDSGVFAPFPPVTQSYYTLRYMNGLQRGETTWLSFVTSKFGKNFRNSRSFFQMTIHVIKFGAWLLLYPIKVYRSRRQARARLANGVALFAFNHPDEY